VVKRSGPQASGLRDEPKVNHMNSPLLPIPDAGRFLGHTGKTSGKTTIHKHCTEGRLTKVKIGGRSFITLGSAEQLIQDSLAGQIRTANFGQQEGE
jgi:hypothetical protein